MRRGLRARCLCGSRMSFVSVNLCTFVKDRNGISFDNHSERLQRSITETIAMGFLFKYGLPRAVALVLAFGVQVKVLVELSAQRRKVMRG